MKTGTSSTPIIGLFIIFFLVSCPAFMQQQVQAQESNGQETAADYSREELAQMLAPIALYPDALLSQVLMAATYPLEIIEADRWLKRNTELQGEALDQALLTREWDPSVKALCHFPSILALMSERISETTTIGNAFLAQEQEVMDMVQELRAKAYDHGNLATTEKQKIIVEKETIIIEPVNPRVIYVPYYNPYSIYGPWWYPAYPPYYWGPAGSSAGVNLSYWPGFYVGFAFGSWSYFDWHRHYIHIDVHKRPRYVRHEHWWKDPGRWHHSSRHRRGVAYRDKSTARKYGQFHVGSRRFRTDTRGYPESFRWRRDHSQRFPSQPRTDRNWRTNERTQIKRPSLQQQRLETQRQLPQRLETQRRQHPLVEPPIRDRRRIEPERKLQQIPVRQREVRQPPERQGQGQRRIQRQQYRKSRDNVFNRVDDAGMERRSSERGRYSRQRFGHGSRERGRGPAVMKNRSDRGDHGRRR